MHFEYFFMKEWQLGIVLIVCFVFGIFLFVFFGYHIYLVYYNYTTNEAFKRKELNDLIN